MRDDLLPLFMDALRLNPAVDMGATLAEMVRGKGSKASALAFLPFLGWGKKAKKGASLGAKLMKAANKVDEPFEGLAGPALRDRATGKILTAKTGTRPGGAVGHEDILAPELWDQGAGFDDGFVTTLGRYVSRAEAAKLKYVPRAGSVRPKTGLPVAAEAAPISSSAQSLRSGERQWAQSLGGPLRAAPPMPFARVSAHELGGSALPMFQRYNQPTSAEARLADEMFRNMERFSK